MWYVSFHGGQSGINNIHVYHDTGKPHDEPELLPTGKRDPDLRELRAFCVAGKTLYVVNAYQGDSAILAYSLSADAGCVFDRVVASTRTVPALVHPYDLAVDAHGRLYVSSQDTNVVTGLDARGAALPTAPFLQRTYAAPGTRFAPGTIVASSIGTLPGAAHPAPDVPKPQGLGVEFDGGHDRRVLHSVRGIACAGGHLYVADEPENAVKVYALDSGELHGEIKGPNLEKPVQLLVNEADGRLYIGSKGNDSVLRYKIAGAPPAGTVEPHSFVDGQVEHISGMAFDDAGRFYAVERTTRKIKAFPSDGKGRGEDFVTGLPDDPEFIWHVPKTASWRRNG